MPEEKTPDFVRFSTIQALAAWNLIPLGQPGIEDAVYDNVSSRLMIGMYTRSERG
jgi:hypothetical protein